MAQTEKESIYVDLRKLRSAVYRATYEMEARSRVVWMDDVQKEIAQCIRIFVRAKMRRNAAQAATCLDALDEEFAVVKVDLRNIDAEHIWRGKKDDAGNMRIAKEVFDLIARIDEGIRKWRHGLKKGRVAPELQDAAV